MLRRLAIFPIISLLICNGKLNAQLGGVYSVPGSFTSIGVAIASLNTQGVNAAVTINIAAGHTETVSSGGYSLTVTGTSVNTITFKKTGTGANPRLFAYTGGTATANNNIQDGVLRLIGSDYITFDGIDIVDNNTTNPATMEYGYGMFKLNPGNGCQNNTIKNSTVTLTRVNVQPQIGASRIAGSIGIFISDAEYTFLSSGTNPTLATGANSFNKIYGNRIDQCNTGIALSAQNSSQFFDEQNDVGGSLSITGNTITNFGGQSSSISSGITVLNQYNYNVANNLLNSNNGAGGNAIGVTNGIYSLHSTNANATINQNTISIKSNAGGSSLVDPKGIFTEQFFQVAQPFSSTLSITSNLISNCSYSNTTFRAVYNTCNVDYLTINNNTITAIQTVTINSSFFGIHNNGNVAENVGILSNAIYGFSVSVNGNFRAIYNQLAAPSSSLSINGNTIQSISSPTFQSAESACIYASASHTSSTINNNYLGPLSMATTTLFGIYNQNNGKSMSVCNNTITGFNKTLPGGFIYGYYNSLTTPSGSIYIARNVVSNFIASPSSIIAGLLLPGRVVTARSNTIMSITVNPAAAVSGIQFLANAAMAAGSVIDSNLIHTITGGTVRGIESGSFGGQFALSTNTIHTLYGNPSQLGAVAGIYFIDAKAVVEKNRIFNLEAGGFVKGMWFDQIGGSVLICNNLIGDLRSPNGAGEVIRALHCTTFTSSATFSVYFNTIYLNAVSTSSVFGSSCIWQFGKMYLKNNILVNNSNSTVPNEYSACVRGPGIYTTTDSTSNNNLFWSTGGANRYYYNFVSGSFISTKNTVTPRETNSVEELPTFVSLNGFHPQFLKPSSSVPTQIESGAIPASPVVTDYSGALRNLSTPDIGAWESYYLPADSISPAITSVSISSGPCNQNGITVTANIIDPSSVATGSLAPRCYFKLNNGAFTSVAGALASGNSNNGIWNFALSYSANPGNVLSFYVTAQDAASPSHVGAIPNASFVAVSVNSILTHPANVYTTTIIGVLNGTFTVGSGGSFTTVSAAAQAYNTWCLAGPVTFLLTDALYSTNESFPITFSNNPMASAAFSLLVRPAGGISSTISGGVAAPAVVHFSNARYITINGINSGGSDLTVSNNNTNASAAIWIASTNTPASGCKRIEVKNLMVFGGSNATVNNVGILCSGSQPSVAFSYLSGNTNDSIVISGNAILRSFHGISVLGGPNALRNIYTQVVNNTVGPASSGSNSIGGSGIICSSLANANISSNLIRNINTNVVGAHGLAVYSLSNTIISSNTLTALNSNAATFGVNTIAGILIESVNQNLRIEKNIISAVSNSAIAGYFGARGISINTSGGTGNSVVNNMVSDIWGRSGNTPPLMPIGLAIEGATDNFEIAHNSINLQGSYPNSWPGNTSSAALYANFSGSNINLRNNQFSNFYNNTNSSLDVAYAIYQQSATPNFSINNYNNYYVGGGASTLTLAYFAGSMLNSLSAIQSNFGGNANSQTILPVYVSPTDLHLVPGSNISLDNLGVSIPAVYSDIDNQTRSAINPDIGADEFFTFSCSTPTNGVLNTTSVSICVGQSALLFGSGSQGNGISYQWKTATMLPGTFTNVPAASVIGNSVTVQPLVQGTYYFQMESSCASSTQIAVSNIATVIVNAFPVPTIAGSSLICLGQNLFLTAQPSGANYYWTGPNNYTSALQSNTISNAGLINSGIYSLSVTNASCTSQNTLGVSVQIASIAVSNSGPYCNGLPIQLNSGAAVSYSWSGPASFVSNLQNPVIQNSNPTMSGNYTLTANLGACQAIAISSVAVSSPTASASGNGPICAGSSLLLSGGGVGNFYWQGPNSFTSNAQSPTLTNVSPNSSGVYTLIVSNSNFCADTAGVLVNILSLNVSVASTSSAICDGQSILLNASGANSYTWQPGNLSGGTAFVSPTLTTTYSVIGTSTDGCISVNPTLYTITVNANPTISVNSGTVCSGQVFTLNAGGAATYTYSGASYTVTPSVNSTYSVSGTSVEGCPSLSFAISNVTVLANPTISVSDGTVCAGQVFTINPSGAFSYSFSVGNGTVSPSISTAYSVTGTSSAGCVSQVAAVCNVTVFANPSITVNSGSICSGQVYTIAPSGASSYSFSGNSNTVAPLSTIVYSVVGASSVGCLSQAAALCTVNVFPNPTVAAASGSICEGSIYTINPTGAFTYTFSSGSNTVSPASTMVFTITGTSAAGCLSQAQALCTVSVFSNPTISVNSGSICAGQVFTITAAGASSYTYSGNSSTVAPNSTTSYSVTGTNSNGCMASVAAICSVSVVPGPVLVAFSTPSIACAGESVTLTVSGASSYLWSTGALSNSIIVQPMVNSTYSVTGINTASCSASTLLTQSVDNCTGMMFTDNSNLNANISVYPNPNSGVLFIELSQTTVVKIINALGAVVFTQELSQGKHTIDLRHLSNGVYFINTSTSNNLHFIKLVKS